ncbi:MAG: geranylgeranyl reductase family protein [Nitrospirota bacterium]|nr:geranylgeranyl reductase family protein [Nitrospirota bacterium]
MVYDVIVIGAGPAGSTCAGECARRGLRTLLLDRAAFPRPKPCGGALSQRSISRLGFPLPPEIIDQECFAISVHYGPERVEVRKRQRICAMVSRERFDLFLANKAIEQGADFHQDEQATGVSDGRDTVEVRTAQGVYRSRYVVAADGANSIAARSLRSAFARTEILAALVSSVPAAAGTRGDTLEMHFGIAPQGYAWVFPHREYDSVGVVGLAEEFSGAQQCLAEFARSRNITLTGTRGHTIPLGGIERQITGQRVLLAGDAAGFADPFDGEGMGNAVLSGALAAQAIAEQGNEPGTCTAWYEDRCEELLLKDLRIALRMARLLDRYPRFFLTLFFTHKGTLEQYVDIALGKSDYVRFQRWVLIRLPLFLLFHGVRTLFKPRGANRK